MKKAILLVAILVMLAWTMPVAADVPGPGGPFNSAFTIQNLDQVNPATCVVNLYDSSGVASGGTLSGISMSAGGNYFVYVPTSFGSIASGSYSGVVSCDREVAVVSNFSDSDSGASYTGFSNSDVATELYAPGLYKNYYGYNSNVVIQNAGSANADIYFTVYEKGNSTPVLQTSATGVVPGTSVNFDQATQSIPVGLHSAIVTSTQEIAVVGNINDSVQMYSYNGFATGSQVAYAPSLFNNYYGWNSSLTVLNLGNATTTVDVTYSNGYTTTADVAAKDFYFSYTPSESGIPAGSLVSARVESSSEDVVVLVNESNSLNRAASYNGFVAGAQTWVAPVIMKGYYSYDTSITCQNIDGGGSPGNFTVTYSNGWSESVTGVADGSTAIFYQPSASGLPSGFNGSATIVSTVDSVCVVNENQEGNTSSGDWLFSYNAVSQ
jgi:hypothetical protein